LSIEPKDYKYPDDILKGRIILITGASDGIGRALAVHAAELGAQVILHGRNTGRLEAVHDEIEGIKGAARPSIAVVDFATASSEEFMTLGQSIEDSCESGAVEEMFFGDSGQEETHVEEPTGEKDYRGYPSMTLEQVRQWIRTCDDAGIQILAHTNGDAATDLLIDAIKAERKDWPRPDLRTVIIHAQTMREDQLDFSATHGLVPSFFPIHVVYWGDRHRDIFLGPKRAARINPARSALDRGMKMTIHHDAPVAGISMLNVVDAAVNRITSSGKLLGAEQRITPYEALRAVTKDAAWQYFEEHRKGTIEAGKLADFVILDKDPLAVDSETIKDIRVFETIKEGATIYTRSE